YATQLVGECVMTLGVDKAGPGTVHPGGLRRAAGASEIDLAALQAECRKRMPAYMVPAGIEQQAGPLPRRQDSRQWTKRGAAHGVTS
ncbi:MAG: hypothetical protein U5N10_04655, partial [Gemmobacter sp.]|nr:hypothetical protein [Gemmobacter sp.]